MKLASVKALQPVVRHATVLAGTLILTGLLAGGLLAVTVGDRPAQFIGLKPHPDGFEASGREIFVNNARVLMTVLIAATTVMAAVVAARDGNRLLRTATLAVRTVTDLVIAAIVTVNVGLVAIALAAFGSKALSALWLHGPVETFGFALALALYLAARRGRLTVLNAAAVVALAISVLAFAALLETHTPKP